MDEQSDRATTDDRHATAVDRSLRELQRVVAEHEDALNRLREAPLRQPQQGAASSAKASLAIMKAAYEDVTQSEPFLPFPDSVLPALLALRKTHCIINESHHYLSSQKATLEKAQKRLEVEQANLNDQKLLKSALEGRIAALRSGLESRMEMTPEQIAEEKLDELRQKKRDYDKDTSKLLKAFKKFIDDHLGPLLAAEELGGPVVGDMMDIDTEDLAAGFSAHGKLKKPAKNPDQDKRQRRIDDIWGDGQAQNPGQRKGAQRDEAAAAGAEMRNLTEELLNSLAESGGDSSAAYVRIPRESAAARFLVRSKVAQFHAKDATRLRLVDFGRELDD